MNNNSNESELKSKEKILPEEQVSVESWKFRWVFIILSTIIMVFYSEKMYWYIQGYEYVILVLIYIFGTYSFLWSISFFKINDFWPMLLAAVLFPLYVEGVFTGIIIADVSSIMLAYFIGWHTTLSVILGWYFHRKWLINDDKIKLIFTSIFIGIILGLWATTFWLPENLNDPELQNDPFIPGQWSIIDYSMLLIYIGSIYVTAHYLLGRKKSWITEFTPSKIENGIILSFFILYLIFDSVIYGLFMIIFMIYYILIFIILKKYKNNRTDDTTIFYQLKGSVKLSSALLLYIIPIFSIITYATMFIINPSYTFIRTILNVTILSQMIYGYALLIISIIKTLKLSNR